MKKLLLILALMMPLAASALEWETCDIDSTRPYYRAYMNLGWLLDFGERYVFIQDVKHVWKNC